MNREADSSIVYLTFFSGPPQADGRGRCSGAKVRMAKLQTVIDAVVQ
jgi:hypothetical protein